ncbi:MAG: TraR/DksA family transcriptional regulator [Planctomycetota bacterium]
MAKFTKAELTKFRRLLESQLASLRGDVGSMKDEALRASDQDSSVDHLADQGTDNYDQGFLLGLIENEEETIERIEEALERIEGRGDWPYGACPMCMEELEGEKAKPTTKSAAKSTKSKSTAKAPKADYWIPADRLEYVPWARYCVRHQEEAERRASA